MQLAAECALFKPKLALSDVAASKDSSVQKCVEEKDVISPPLKRNCPYCRRYLYKARRRQAKRLSSGVELQWQQQKRGLLSGVRRTLQTPESLALTKGISQSYPAPKPKLVRQPPPPARPRTPLQEKTSSVKKYVLRSRFASLILAKHNIFQGFHLLQVCLNVPNRPILGCLIRHQEKTLIESFLVRTLDDLTSRLKQQQDENAALRAIIRESFSAYAAEMEEGESVSMKGSGDGGNHCSSDPSAALLPHLPRPGHSGRPPFALPSGPRLVDIGLLALALEKAQLCPCARTGTGISFVDFFYCLSSFQAAVWT